MADYSVRPVNLFADFLAGREAAYSERAMKNRNALAELDIDQQRGFNALSRDPNASPEQFARLGRSDVANAITNQRTFESNSKQQAVQQLGSIAQKALTISDPATRKAFLRQASQVYGGAFSALGADPMKGLAEMEALPDAELAQRLSQVAAFGPAQPKPEAYTLGEGQVRFEGDKEVARGPAKRTDPEERWTPLTPPELKAAGLPEGTVAQRSSKTGKVEIVQKAPGTDKPLPVGALRIAQDARDALSVAGGVDTALSRIDNQIATGKLNLGMFTNLAARGQNAVGVSSENSRNYQLMRSTFEKMRNDSLRLNKGVQTEGDSQRAWDELFANLNDEKAVRAQLARIKEINARAIQLQQENLDAVYENYGRETPASSVIPQSPAQEITATGPNGQKIVLRNGQWVPL
jgi:hypothetical protein